MKFHHYIIYKPYGYISQFVYTHKRKKKLLGDLHDFSEGTMAIGRLDVKSEGLLLLTTNGKVSQLIRSRKIEKEYYVQVDGIITEEMCLELSKGVIITVDGEPYQTLPCKVHQINPPEIHPRIPPVRDDRHGPTSWISITLKEGKFHQVRKMTAKVVFPTLRLVRVRIGNISLAKMESGEVIEVESFDI